MKLIDADELYKKFIDGESDTEQEKSMNQLARYLIRHADTVDATPVVRCRKCIHWHDWGACGHPDNGFDATPMGPDDFCSKGEPKNELE